MMEQTCVLAKALHRVGATESGEALAAIRLIEGDAVKVPENRNRAVTVLSEYASACGRASVSGAAMRAAERIAALQMLQGLHDELEF